MSQNSIQTIDINFNFFKDTPLNKDPDAYSPTLRRYHQLLWSKDLPNGEIFNLSMPKKEYLRWDDLALSSDAITNSYRGNKRMAALIAEVKSDADAMFTAGSTIGAYIIFPSRQIDGKVTINAARGMNLKIADRFDLTLECIRLHYAIKESPLSDVFARYRRFFELFVDFEQYVDFFLLRDLVTYDHQIKFFLPFDGFTRKGVPENVYEYRTLKDASMTFIKAREERMLASVCERG
jgi:hypothetical protein